MRTRPWVRAWKIRRQELLAKAGLAHSILGRYPYSFTPRQLQALTGFVDETAGLDGIALEVGCAWAATTVFLQRHMADIGHLPPYHCIDTFTGFTSADVGSERRRGKGYAYDDFDLNSENLFRQTLIANGVQENTTVHRADVSEFNFATLPPVSFALVDVDLYRPMHAAVEGVWEVLQPGGLMVLDDCGPDEKWDGAGTAHREFCAQYGLPVEVVARKLGVVRRPARP